MPTSHQTPHRRMAEEPLKKGDKRGPAWEAATKTRRPRSTP